MEHSPTTHPLRESLQGGTRGALAVGALAALALATCALAAVTLAAIALAAFDLPGLGLAFAKNCGGGSALG